MNENASDSRNSNSCPIMNMIHKFYTDVPADWARLCVGLCSWQRLRTVQSHTWWLPFAIGSLWMAILARAFVRLLRVDPIGALALGRRHFDLVLQTDSLQPVDGRYPNVTLQKNENIYIALRLLEIQKQINKNFNFKHFASACQKKRKIFVLLSICAKFCLRLPQQTSVWKRRDISEK